MSERDLNLLLAPERICYHEFPVRRTVEEYELALEAYVERVRHAPGIVGVARFGAIRTPGISDLDVVVFTEPSFGAATAAALAIDELPRPDLGLFVHPPFVAPWDGRQHFAEHLNWPALTPVWGQIPDLPTPDGSARRWHAAALLVERLAAYLVTFARWSHTRRVGVRVALPLLHSLRFSFGMAADLLDETPDAWQVWARGMEELRASWFDLAGDAARAEALRTAIAEAWTFASDCAFRLERWFRNQGALPWLADAAGGTVLALDTWELLATVPAHHPGALVEAYLELNRPAPAAWQRIPGGGTRRLARFHWLAAPASYGALAAATMQHAGGAGAQLRAACIQGEQPGGFEARTQMETCLVARAQRLGAQASFLQRNGLSFGAACSGLTWLPEGRVAPHRRDWRRRALWAAHLAYGLPRYKALVSGSSS